MMSTTDKPNQPTPPKLSNLSPSSITAYNTYGVTPNNLRFMVQNIFYFPNRWKDCLTNYYLEILDTHEFIAHMKEGMYQDIESAIEYQVIYHKTDPARLLRRKEHGSVKLSFRVVATEFDIIPTVLVKEIIES